MLVGYAAYEQAGQLVYRKLEDLAALEQLLMERPCRVWAHGGSRAEFLLLIRKLALDYRYVKAGTLFGGGLIRFLYERSECIDSFKIMPAKLSEIADGLGVTHIGLDYHHIRDEDPRTVADASANHAYILHRALKRTAKFYGYDLATLPNSASSIAMRDFEKFYGKLPELDRITRACCNLARYPGRNEIAVKDREVRIHRVDRNSAYASSGVRPTPVQVVMSSRDIEKAHFVKADVTVPDGAWGLLPYRHQGAVYWPTGRFNGWYATNELRAAVRLGARVDRVRSGFVCRTEDFSEWFKRRYRDRSNPHLRASGIAKRVLVSPCGKLQQQGIFSVVTHTPKHPDRAEKLGMGYYLVKLRRPPKTNLMAAAWWLADARARLLEQMAEHGWSECLAVHTDATDGPWALPERPGLSGRKTKFRGLARYLAPGIYQLTDKRTGEVKYKAKGQPNLDGEGLKDLFENLHAELHRMPTLRDVLEGELQGLDVITEANLGIRRSIRLFADDGSSVPYDVQELIDDTAHDSAVSRRIRALFYAA